MLSLGSLYAQYIPAYAIGREQILLQAATLPAAIAAANPNGLNICMYFI